MQSGRSSTSSAGGSALATSTHAELGSSAWTIAKLGVGALGLAWSLTTTAAYLPPVLGQYTSSTSLIGAVLGAEGIFAITLPLVIGPWSDTFHTPMGRRRPFMAVAIGPMGFCLALMAFMPNLWTTALLVFAFFFAYYVYEPPYRGLYPDLLPDNVYGRAQGVQHLFRGIALGGALIGGGLLYHLWQPAPFLFAVAIVVAACLVPVLFLREDGGHGRVFEGVTTYLRHSWHVLRGNPNIGRFLIANAAWEGTFAGARTFVVLYVTVGLGEELAVSTLVLAAVAAGYVVAALVAGPIGDRFGLARVITFCSLVYGTGLLCGGLATTWHGWYLVPIFVVAIFGGSVMTLAWGLLFKLMPEGDRGAISGLATTTKGFGLIFGTLLAGVLIDLARPYFPETDGYQVLWPILSLPILFATPLVASLIRAEEHASHTAPKLTADS